MPTSIDIASNALILIGDEAISSFQDPGSGAEAAANLYPETYKQVLSEHPWTFALKEQQLSRLSAEPDDKTNYRYAFQLPADLIRLWAIMPHSDYTIVGSLLYSNQTELLSRYVYQVNETSLPAHIVKTLEYKLASDFAMLVTEDAQKAQYYEAKYLDMLGRAKSIDSQGRPPTPIIDSPFVDVRFGGYSRYFWS